MEITPQNLLKKKDDFVVCKQRYFLEKGKRSIVCFVEGKYDNDYYLDNFRNHLGEDFGVVVCMNKKNVLKAYDSFYEKDAHSIKMGFFVDHDFEPSVNNPDIFETERYAIENYYCSEDVLERILRFGMKIEDEDIIVNARKFYSERFDKFHEVVGEFNAFYSLIKQKELANNTCYKVCLDDKFPKCFADVDVERLDKKYTVQDLLNAYSLENTLIKQTEIDEECKRLKDKNPFVSYRGKYELDFMYKILFKLVDDANKRKSDRIITQSISANLNKKSFMSDYSQYADIALGLNDYLKKISA